MSLKLPSIIGHRGACGYAPENTLASFEAAASLGVKCVEFDVKLTANNDLVVIHDDNIDRTTSGKGAVGKQSLEMVQSYDAGSWFDDKFSHASVPGLIEVIDFLNVSKITANIEIKASPGLESETARVVCGFIKNQWPSGMPQPLLSSFASESLMEAQSMAPEIERAKLFKDLPNDWKKQTEMVGARSVHIWHKKLTKIQAEEIIDAGYPLRSYTVNDSATAQRLFEWGLESVISDFPDRIIL